MKLKSYIILALFLLTTTAVFGQNSFHQEIYQAFINRDIKKWETATLKFEKEANLTNTADALKLIHCYYGWTSELIDAKQFQKAEENIKNDPIVVTEIKTPPVASEEPRAVEKEINMSPKFTLNMQDVKSAAITLLQVAGSAVVAASGFTLGY